MYNDGWLLVLMYGTWKEWYFRWKWTIFTTQHKNLFWLTILATKIHQCTGAKLGKPLNSEIEECSIHDLLILDPWSGWWLDLSLGFSILNLSISVQKMCF